MPLEGQLVCIRTGLPNCARGRQKEGRTVHIGFNHSLQRTQSQILTSRHPRQQQGYWPGVRHMSWKQTGRMRQPYPGANGK